MLDEAKGRRWREGPLAEINNSKELEAWLRKQPREVSVASAARAALRVLPMIVQDARGRGDFFAGIVLPVFRATGVAWAAAKYPARATHLKTAAARAAGRVFAADAAPFAAFRAFAADADATEAARAAAAAAAHWSAVSLDATGVEEGAAASVIAGSPLWPQGQPDQLRSLWQELKAALVAEKQDWQVWTLWYDDRLDGRIRD